MSFYLAWSLTRLLLTLLWIVAVVVLTLYYNKKLGMGIPKKVLVCVGVMLMVVTMFSAINTGDRQSALGRSSFNADAPNAVEKVVVSTLNSEEVNKQFNKSIEEGK